MSTTDIGKHAAIIMAIFTAIFLIAGCGI